MIRGQREGVHAVEVCLERYGRERVEVLLPYRVAIPSANESSASVPHQIKSRRVDAPIPFDKPR